MTINQLSEKRKKLRQQLIKNEMMDGFKKLLPVLYSDKVHFIYELLQNAEDAGASEVQFVLNDDRLEFEHNGDKLFTIEDVESITNIGSSTKIDDVTSIGKFGIGFKSVFAYTATPEIESGGFHFRIHDMFVPDTEGLPPGALGEKRTRFVFPFDNPGKSPEKAVEEIETKFRQLNENTLLFLSNIQKIEYHLPNLTMGSLERKEVANDRNRIEISIKHPESVLSKSTHYLRFTESVNVQDEDGKPKPCQIAIAFGMDKSKGGSWRIIPLNPGQVCIYFPAIEESSSLRFHIHAPFASTVARASVQKDCPANDELRDHIAGLIAQSMHTIRNQGLLNVRFLATLPSNKDDLSPFYHPIRERLVEEFNRTQLVPMKQGGHAPASECYRGHRDLSNLIDDEDLATLLDKPCSQPLWLANPQQKNQQDDNFLSMLDISIWTIEDLVEALESFKDITKWLEKKSNAWHQKLYAFLGNFLSSAPSDSVVQERKDQLSKLCIVRCNDKTYRIGSECRFSNDDMKFDPPKDGTQEDGLHFAAKGVYSYGKNKSQQEKARKFLDKIGVSEWNVVTEVLDHILPKYRNSTRAIPRKEFDRDFTKIVKAYRTDPQQLQEELMTAPLILTKNSRISNLIYLKPDQLCFGVKGVLWSKKSIGTYSVVSVTKKVHQFLQKLDIPQWDIVEEIIKTVLPKYSRNPPTVSINEHLVDLEKITHAYNISDQFEKKQLQRELQATPFILTEDTHTGNPGYREPGKIYFGTDELRLYFDGNDSAKFVNLESYPCSARTLFEDLKVLDFVRVERLPKDARGRVVIYKHHGSHKRGLNGFDPSIEFDGLEYALNNPTPEKSAFIWNEIARSNVDCIRGTTEKSRYQDYVDPDTMEERSDKFGGLLIDKKWLPDSDGNMHKPSEITLEELPESFHRDERLADQLGMKKNEVAELAERAGVSAKVINKISQSPELRAKVEEWISEQEAYEEKEKEIPEQPIQEKNIPYDKTPVDTLSTPPEFSLNVDEGNNNSTEKDSEMSEIDREHADLVDHEFSVHTSSRPSVKSPNSRGNSRGTTGGDGRGHGRSGGGGPGKIHENLKDDLAHNPSQLGGGLRLVRQEHTFKSGDRVDILLMDSSDKPVTVEVKPYCIPSGSDSEILQALKYKHLAADDYDIPCKQVRCILAAPEIPDDVMKKCRQLGIEPFIPTSIDR